MNDSITYKVIDKIQNDFKDSIIIKALMKLLKYIGKLFEESYIIKKIFNKENRNNKIKVVNNNFIFQIINKILNLIAKYLNMIKNESLAIKLIKKTFSFKVEKIFFDSFILFLSFIHSLQLINFITNSANIIGLIIMIVIDLVIIMYFLFNNIKGSEIILFLKSFFNDFDIKNSVNLKNISLFFLGIFFAIICNKIGIFLFVEIILGIVSTYFIFRFYEIGIYIFVLGIPFFPDKITVLVLLLTVISGMIRWALYEEFTFNKNKYNIILVLLVLIFIINTILSVNVMGSIRDLLINVLSIGLMLTMINNIESEKVINRVFYLIIITSFFTAIYGIIQYIIGIPMESGWVDPKSNISIRVFSAFENPNLFAEYLILVIPITIAKFISSDMKYKIIYFIALLTQLIVLGLTFSRGGWLGLIVSLGVFVLLMKRNLIFKLIPIGLVSLLIMPNSILVRMKSIVDLSDSSNFYRLQIWKESINIIKDFFITGVGLGFESFRTISNLYIKDFSPFHAHNTYLELTIEIGIVGLIIFLALLVLSFFDVKNQCNNKNKIYTVALMSGIIGIFVHGVAEHVLYNPKIIFEFWLVLGLLITMNIKFMKVRD